MSNYSIMKDCSIQLNNGPYSGVTYRYGGVQLSEDEVNEALKVTFSYDIISGDVADRNEFKNYIGPILLELIEKGLEEENLVYYGGA